MFDNYSLIDWNTMVENADVSLNTIDKIKHRVKYYVSRMCQIHVNGGDSRNSNIIYRDNTKLALTLIDFYFDYAKLKNVNPVVAIIQSLIETSFFSYLDSSATLKEKSCYKNTAGIKINDNVTSLFDKLFYSQEDNWNSYISTDIYNRILARNVEVEKPKAVSDYIPFMHKQFINWTDSIRAQIDHIALFQNSCSCSLDGKNLTHLSHDPRHRAKIMNYKEKIKDLNESDNDLIPSIRRYFIKYSSAEYSKKVIARLNLILCNFVQTENNVPILGSPDVRIFFDDSGNSKYTGSENIDNYKEDPMLSDYLPISGAVDNDADARDAECELNSILLYQENDLQYCYLKLKESINKLNSILCCKNSEI